MLTLSYRRFLCEQADALHLVLIHGWGLHSGVWDKVIEPLRAFAHVTVLDRAGYGHSPVMTPEQEQQAVLAIAPECAIYIGWSLGGVMVLDMATRYPERVMAVVLVAVNPCFVQRDDWLGAMSVHEFKSFHDRVRTNPYVALMRFIALQCQGSPTQRDDIRFLQQQLALYAIPHSSVLLAGLTVLLESDSRPQIKQLRCPILWMEGAKDSVVQVGIEAIFALNLLIAFNTISQAAHVPFVSHSDLFVRVIKRFLHELQHDSF